MKKLLSIVFLSLFAAFLCAEELTVTVEQAVELAMQNNSDIKKAKKTLQQLEKAEKYSWNSVSPSLRLTGNFGIPTTKKTTTDSATGEKKVVDGFYPSVSLGASVSFNFTPSLYTAMKEATLAREKGEITYEESLRKVELAVRKDFYQLLISQENIDFKKRTVEGYKTKYELSYEKYIKGQLSEIDMLSSKVTYEKSIPDLKSSENTLLNNIEKFKITLGIPAEVTLIFKGDISSLLSETEISFNESIESLPSIKKQEIDIESKKNSLLATRFSYWGPSLTVGYNWTGSDRALNYVDPYNKDKEGNPKKSEWENQSGDISIGVSIPLDGYFPWSKGALAIDSQKNAVVDAQENLALDKVNLKQQIENTIRTINLTKSMLKSLESNVALAQKTYELTLTAYNLGSKDLLSLQTASEQVLQANDQLQQQKFQLISNILELENTLGVPFGTLIK